MDEVIKRFIKDLRDAFEDNSNEYESSIIEKDIALLILEKSINDVLLEEE